MRRSRGEERRAAKWVNLRRGSRNEGFPSGSVFDTSKLSRNTGQGDGDDIIASERGVDKSRSSAPSLSHLKHKQQQLMMMRCREKKMRRDGKFLKRNSQGKDPNTYEGNSQRRDPKNLERNS